MRQLKPLRIIGYALLGLLGVLGGIVAARAVTAPSHQLQRPPGEVPSVDGREAAGRLARGLRVRTVSTDEGPPSEASLAALRDVLEASFPLVHQTLTREVLPGGAMLLTWLGSAPELPPALLLGHQDVVPAGVGSASSWRHPPFDGVIDDDGVWGRGALDNKGPMFGMLEAVERLLQQGRRPRRTALFAFGHDEEIGGRAGARQLALLLEQRGVRPLFLLDEGGAIIEGLLPGFEEPVAAIGVFEKGYLTLELSARGPGGHSSAPPKDATVARLARALVALDEHPFPADLDRGIGLSLSWLAPELQWSTRVVVSNLWLFEPLVLRELESVDRGNAAVRTTTAPTMLQGSEKENVLPDTATAVVNFRLLPGDTIDDVTSRVSSLVAPFQVTVARRSEEGNEAPERSPTDGPGWDDLVETLRDVFPEALVTPTLMVAGTDSKHYTAITDRIYRFMPLSLGPDDLARYHGVDERMPLDEYGRMIAFYEVFFRRVLETTRTGPTQPDTSPPTSAHPDGGPLTTSGAGG